MRYQGVIFDLYGTLVEPFRGREGRGTIAAMAKVLGVPEHDLLGLWGTTFTARERGAFASIEENLRHVCDRLGVGRDAARVAAAAALRLDLHRRSLRPRAGSLETLAALREAGLRTGLVSNASVQTPELWRETSLAPLVEVPVFSSDAGLSKPDPRIYRLACEGLGLAPGRCLYVGDGSDGELEGARGAGLHPVLIRVPGDDPDAPPRSEARAWRGSAVPAVSGILDLVAT